MKKIVLILLILISILSACSNENLESNKGNGEFTIENISINNITSGEKYFLVIPIKWSGEEKAEIKSIEILQGEVPIGAEDGISYKFYGGDQNKKVGVYQRNDIGEKEKIKGYKINEKGTIILETTLVDVKENKNRKVKITYIVNGIEHEQIISSSTFSQLSTE